jgi:hypothetical protein
MSKCHDLTRFAAETVALNTKWLLKQRNTLPATIDELYLWSDQGRLEVAAIMVRGGGKTEEILHDDHPETSLPLDDESDELLEAFREANELDDLDEELDWGDYFALPESIYRMEMIRCAHAVAAAGREAGLAFAPKAKVGIMIEDEAYCDPEAFASHAREALAKLAPKVAKGLLALYYTRGNDDLLAKRSR